MANPLLLGRKILKRDQNHSANIDSTCSDLIEPRKVPANSTLSYFFSISIAQPTKMRVKIPNMLVRTMWRRSQDGSSDDEHENHKEMKKRVTPRKLFSKKVGLILSNVFGCRKIQEKTCSKGEKGIDLENKQQEKRKKMQGQVSVRSFFKRENNGVVIGRQECSAELPMVPSRTLITRQRLTMARSMRKMSSYKKIRRGEGKEEEEEELCKKRILMGKRCRALNPSGILHYDKDGVLLPEDEYPEF